MTCVNNNNRRKKRRLNEKIKNSARFEPLLGIILFNMEFILYSYFRKSNN